MKLDKSKYNYSWGDGIVKFNSLSPNGQYYYQITKPFDFYWGLFVAKISFLSISGNLVHFDKSICAHPLSNLEQNISYAWFSKDGNFAYYIEQIDLQSLNHILIDLKNHQIKRKQWTKDNDFDLDNRFDISNLKIFDNVNWIKTTKDYRKKRNLFLKKYGCLE